MSEYVRSGLVVLVLALVAGPGGAIYAAADKFDVLIIDETQTLEESFCVEMLARAMLAANLFEFRAEFAIPWGFNPTPMKYDIIVMIPERIKQVWLVTAELPTKLSEAMRQALTTLKQQVTAVYTAAAEAAFCLARRPVGVDEDLAPALYGALFARHGWLKRER